MNKVGNYKKAIIVLMAVVLTMGCVIGGTIAWISTSTDPVVNTFTWGDIEITLTETITEFKMVPGNDIDKDPVVGVLADSEACWLFVQITESDNFDDFMTYNVADGWTPLETYDGTEKVTVWYREVSAEVAEAGTGENPYQVLAGDKVTVLDTVEKADFDALTEATKPTLTFVAYAVQKDNVDTAAEAWDIAVPSN